MGAVSPVPLENGATRSGAPGAEVRLVRKPIAQNEDPSQQLWVLEMRNSTNNEWANAYCFTELEWLPEDFTAINYHTSQNPRSWFTYRLVLSQTLLDEKQERAVGTIVMVNNDISRRMDPNSPKETLATCRTEEERVQAIEKWFGIKLLPEERRGIIGMVTEIKPAPTAF